MTIGSKSQCNAHQFNLFFINSKTGWDFFSNLWGNFDANFRCKTPLSILLIMLNFKLKSLDCECAALLFHSPHLQPVLQTMQSYSLHNACSQNSYFYSPKIWMSIFFSWIYFLLCAKRTCFLCLLLYLMKKRSRVIFIQMQIYCFLGEYGNARTLLLLINSSFEMKGFIFNENKLFSLSIMAGDANLLLRKNISNRISKDEHT